MSRDGEFSGRTALVTGASRGIGAAIAESLAASGARVALLARTRKALEDVASRIGNEAIAVQCDLSDPGSVAGAMQQIETTFGGVPDIVVNNAGLFEIRAIEEATVERLTSMVDTNLIAPFLIVRVFLSGMRSRGSGHFVTIGSVADRHIFAGNAAYSATKYGARAVHEVLRAETRGTGIRATLISPASVNTDLWEHIRFSGSDDPPDRSTMLTPDAVARAVSWAVTQPPDVNVDELRLSRT